MESSEEEDGGAPSSKHADDLLTGVPFVKGNSAMTTIVDKSAFTFDILNDFLLDNLECGTSAMNYYSKLRRMTMAVFPHLVPVFHIHIPQHSIYLPRVPIYSLHRYRELMRVARQWRKLKLLKRNGFGHEEKDVRPSDLALFCPACPQPGINVTLPVGEHTEDSNVNKGSDLQTPSWLYTRLLVMDGNFKAEHLHPVHPGDEVSLMDGHGFMVGDTLYKEHLAIAQDTIQQSECNNHCAVNQANASRHRLEATGIGGCACARHGCFVPHAMVDFQKGERQINMDYALCKALKINTDGIRHALTFYDVNCQYHKRLKDRIAESPILEIPKELDIIPGIGLWHVHGHQDSCYVRYASNFIEGAARIDGEIMETLWVPLNIILPATRGMGTPHQKECLDYQMNDCNFMKMIRMSKSLCKNYNQAVRGATDSRLVFEKLAKTADPGKVQEWEVQERLAHQCRRRDPTAMDIYEVQLQKEGLTIEEAQVTLQLDIKKVGDLLILEEESDAEIEDQQKVFKPEKAVIPLPSNLGQDTCTAIGVNDLAKQELILWQGQANDALHNIRVHLADKAVIFRKMALAKEHLKEILREMIGWMNVSNSHQHHVGHPDLADVPVYWVHWLQAKALKDRWEEEILLVQHEMDWTCNFFRHKAEEWKHLSVVAKKAKKEAHMAYMGRQGKIYECLLEEAKRAFHRTKA
ncbi:uncharacterized protein F5147DRAFT_656558 [Suillus discolor]|uniref:CxC2-like cysteine cluster KDZ transposase-associated domain-containing protein n=1 Tax=Suillus discolor TaxID=1912936 RepID=A0A9P7JPH4_9AGAM|nr:uncharacterized protein F5147DRAFT_656558 [Suillus discolor]KAG2096761.1 hypothetical protein F5147DRAFT_656558 [Suillus discolor]